MSLVIPLFIPHRGCPHQCLFCNQESITGISERNDKFLLEAAATIELWLRRSTSPATTNQDVEVAFYGGSFTCLPLEEQACLLGIVQPFIDQGRVHSIRLSTRPDCMTDKIAQFLLEHRVRKVELGVQSLNNEALQASKRGHSVEDSIQAIATLKNAGIQVGVQLMAGLPRETTCSFLGGVERLIGLAPDFVRLYPVVVVAHSELEHLYHEGKYQPLSLNKAVALARLFFVKMKNAAIPVIRMGLQPTVDLDAVVVAGPYHPSFGELVQTRIWFDRIRKRLAARQDGESLIMRISHRDLSAVQGIRKCNIKRLHALGYADCFSIETNEEMVRGTSSFIKK